MATTAFDLRDQSEVIAVVRGRSQQKALVALAAHAPYTWFVSNVAEQLIGRWDYLAIERDGIIRHEWVGGQIYAMTGGTRLHNQISFRLARKLADAAEPQGCQTFMADMKVLTEFAGYYPDVMVACEEGADDAYYEENPCLIAEVASKTTQDRDRREKWVAYKEIGSLKHYLLLSQEDVVIEHRFRTDLGWSTEVLGPTDTLRLQCPRLDITVASIYDGLVTPLNQ
jgi:Uma2 family endonuclease